MWSIGADNVQTLDPGRKGSQGHQKKNRKKARVLVKPAFDLPDTTPQISSEGGRPTHTTTARPYSPQQRHTLGGCHLSSPTHSVHMSCQLFLRRQQATLPVGWSPPLPVLAPGAGKPLPCTAGGGARNGSPGRATFPEVVVDLEGHAEDAKVGGGHDGEGVAAAHRLEVAQEGGRRRLDSWRGRQNRKQKKTRRMARDCLTICDPLNLKVGPLPWDGGLVGPAGGQTNWSAAPLAFL